MATISGFFKSFMLEDLKRLSQEFKITIISGDVLQYEAEFGQFATLQQIDIHRKISLFKDVITLWQLWRFFRKNQFDIVLSATPKAGLLVMLSVFWTKTPRRVHFFTGQVWANKKGLKRLLLKSFDKVIAKLSTHILVAGKAQRDFLIISGVISASKSQTLFHGVDTQLFTQNLVLKKRLRKEYNLAEDAFVLMFLGRINQDKGVLELIEVMCALLPQYPQCVCVLVGENEGDIQTAILDDFTKHDRVYILPPTKQPEKILNLADILLLPSHREGFGSVVIEAAAMKIPTIASDVYGLKDSVISGKTGLIHRVKDKDDMKQKYQQLMTNKHLREELGDKAYQYVIKYFDKQLASQKFLQFIKSL